MKIYPKNTALHVAKPEGTVVDYFLFPGYEIHYNEQVSGTMQTWHHHETLWETLYVIDGELLAEWRENGETKKQTVKAGDLVESENTPHTFTNNTGETVRFLVVKQTLSGSDNTQVFKTDKVLD